MSDQGQTDTVIALLLIIVILGFGIVQRIEAPKQMAVLGNVSRIMTDMEDSLGPQQPTLQAHTDFSTRSIKAFLSADEQTGILGQVQDPWLLPDIDDSDQQFRVGGCPISADRWILIRLDGAALTEIPDHWKNPVERICLDTNGKQEPNQEGVDVIWLSFSRLTMPHITLIPANTKEKQSGEESDE